MTILEAKAQEIFTIVEKRGGGFEIEKTDLFSHVMESEDITTTPRGVAPRFFVEEDSEAFTISTWGLRGNNYKRGTMRFETETEAEDYLFNMVFNEDFMNDDQRSTQYFETQEEAQEYLNEIL